MDYTLFFDNTSKRVSFNFITTIGDLQTIIINSLDIPKNQLLLIIHDTKVLGVDYNFNDSILQHNLFDVNLFIIKDTSQVGVGTKTIYSDWLQSQIVNSSSLPDHHRQILYHQTNNSHIANNQSFFVNNSRPVPTTPVAPVVPAFPASPTTSSIIDTLTNLATMYLESNHGSSALSALMDSILQSPSQTNNTSRTTTRPVLPVRQEPRTRSTTQAPQRSQFTSSTPANTMMSGMLQQLFSSGNTTASSNSPDIQNLINQFLNNANGDIDVNIAVTTVPLNNIPNGADFFSYIMNNPAFSNVPVTLTREGLDRLPVFKFNQLPPEIKNSNECSICRDNFNPNDDVRVLLCKHYFHKSCIDQWLSQENVRCPLCRHDNRQPLTTNSTTNHNTTTHSHSHRTNTTTPHIHNIESDSDGNSTGNETDDELDHSSDDSSLPPPLESVE